MLYTLCTLLQCHFYHHFHLLLFFLVCKLILVIQWLYEAVFLVFTLLYQMVNIISSSDYWINFKAYRKIIIIKVNTGLSMKKKTTTTMMTTTLSKIFNSNSWFQKLTYNVVTLLNHGHLILWYSLLFNSFCWVDMILTDIRNELITEWLFDKWARKSLSRNIRDHIRLRNVKQNEITKQQHNTIITVTVTVTVTLFD